MTPTQPSQAEAARPVFEAWLSKNPSARFWNTTDAMLAAFIAGRAELTAARPLEVAAPVTDAEINDRAVQIAVQLWSCQWQDAKQSEAIEQIKNKILSVVQFSASRVPVALPASRGPAIPTDVLKAAISFQKDGYRGPLAWARKVFDWVVEQGATPAAEQGDAKDAEKADMVWNSDDAEKPHDSIESFLNDEICNGCLETGAEFTLWQARRLPTIKIRVTAIDDEACEAEYEVIDAAILASKATAAGEGK